MINGVSNEARFATLRENDDVLDGIQFLATLDGRTSFVCASLDGKIWRGDEMEKAARPPLHPNCRSTLIPYIELRDPETGEIIDESEDLRDENGNVVVRALTRAAANADFNKLAEESYNKTAREKGLKKRWDDLSPSTRKKYYYQAQRDWETANGGENAYRQVPASTTFKVYFETQPKEFQEAWLGKKRYEAYNKGQLQFADLVKLDSLHTVTIQEFKERGVYFEHSRAIEINVKRSLEENRPFIEENMKVEAEDWVYPALRASGRSLPSGEARGSNAPVDLDKDRSAESRKFTGPPNESVDYYRKGALKFRCFYDENGRLLCVDDYSHPNQDNSHIFPHRHVWFNRAHSLAIEVKEWNDGL